MKALPIILTLFLSTLLFTATSYAQWGKIKGEGPVVTKTISIETFNSIGLGIAADVVLTYGKTQEVSIKAQQNIIDNIKKEVKGNSWEIKFKERASDYKDIIIYITMSHLEAISVGGSGSIKGTNRFIALEDVSISIGGSGDVNLEMESRDVSVSIGGSGEVILKGKGNDLAISIGGSGDVMAFDFEVTNCEVSTAGSGDVEVNVKNNLSVSMVGSGDVAYMGDPEINKTIIGSGEVFKRQ